MTLQTWSGGVLVIYWCVSLTLGWSAAFALRMAADLHRGPDPTLTLVSVVAARFLFLLALAPPVIVTKRWRAHRKRRQ